MKAAFCVLLLVLAVACDKKTPAPAIAPAEGPAASASAKPAPPWFVGTWSGSYTARPRAVDSPKEGYVKEWRETDAGAFSGPGTVTLQIDESGRIAGSAEGALGPLVASGQVTDETLSVTLQSKPADAQQISSAVLVAKRDGDSAKGTLSASTGDSLRVRQADITLTRTRPNAGK